MWPGLLRKTWGGVWRVVWPGFLSKAGGGVWRVMWPRTLSKAGSQNLSTLSCVHGEELNQTQSIYSFKFPAAVSGMGFWRWLDLHLDWQGAKSYHVGIISSGRMCTPVHWYQCSVGTSSVSNAGCRLWLVTWFRGVTNFMCKLGTIDLLQGAQKLCPKCKTITCASDLRKIFL